MSFLKKLMVTAAFSAAMFVNAAYAENVKIALVVKSLGNGFFDAANKGAEEAAKELGDVDIIYTGPTKATAEAQIEVVNSLIAQKVNAIIFYPLDPKATVPVLKQAKKKGIPVVAIDGTFGSRTATAPYLPYIATQVWQGRDIQAFLQAKAMAAAKPKAKVGLIGLGFPVPALKYLNQREAFWARKAGLTIVGSQDNPSDDVTGGEKAANGLVQRYTNMNAIIGYNDPSALGAVIAARGANRNITIVGLNGDSAGLAAVKSGKLAATVRVDPVGWGTQTAIAAYSLITKQNLPLAKIIVRPAELVTKANVSKVASWKAQVKAIH